MDAPDAWEPERLRATLECLLFVAGEPVPARRVAWVLGIEEEAAARALEELRQNPTPGSGLHVVRLAGGYQLCTRPEHAEAVERFLQPAAQRLSRQALETLAIIAYRQPITRPAIEALRGVDCGGVLQTLLNLGLIEERGRAPSPGRPILYGTTPDFLRHFGLQSLDDLPPLDFPQEGKET